MESDIQLKRMAEPISLSGKVYQSLKSAILSLELKPGTPLVEEIVAKQLGVSKTPVRSALDQLSKDGLVDKIPFKGVRVSEISYSNVASILQVRAALEGFAARLATPMFSEEDFQKASEYLHSSEAALKDGNLELYNQYSVKFHNLIIFKANNLYIIAYSQNLSAHLQRYRKIIVQIPERVPKSLEEHKSILAALKQKDSTLVEQKIMDHLLGLIDDISNFADELY